jgi:hypothetical protein
MEKIACKALRDFTQFVPGYGMVHGDPNNSDPQVKHPDIPVTVLDLLKEEGKVEELPRKVKVAAPKAPAEPSTPPTRAKTPPSKGKAAKPNPGLAKANAARAANAAKRKAEAEAAAAAAAEAGTDSETGSEQATAPDTDAPAE